MRDPKVQVLLGFGAVAVIVASVLVGMWIGRSGDVETVAPPATTTSTSTTTTTATTTTAPAPLQTTSTSTIPPIQEFADIFESVRGAIANVDVIGCDSGSQGTAFLVDSDTAYTAWHVVEDAAQIALTLGETRVEASVIGHDPDRDVAVLRLAEPIADAPTIPVTSSRPRVGEEVAAIGHPRGLPLAMTVGRVTSMNGTFDFSGTGADVVENLIQTDSVVAPGSSGGPLVNQRGEAIGIVILKDLAAEGLMYAADIDGVRAELAGWTSDPEPVRAAFCIGSVDLNDIDDIAASLVASDVSAPEVPALQRTYAVYVQSINSGRAADAFGVLGPSITTDNTPEAWAEGQETSNLWDWRIREVRDVDGGLQVRSTFTSTQEAEYGFDDQSTCTRWDITHELVPGQFRDRDFWLIDGSSPTPGTAPVDCLDWTPTIVQRGRILAPAPGELVVVEDLLAAGTIERWSIAVDLPSGADPRAFIIELDALDSSFDPVLRLLDEDGEVVVENDDRAEGDLNATIEVLARVPQVFRIDAKDLSDNAGGAYALTIRSPVG